MKAIPSVFILLSLAVGCSTTDHRTVAHVAPLHTDITIKIERVQELTTRRAAFHHKIHQLYAHYRHTFATKDSFPDVWSIRAKRLPVPPCAQYCDNQRSLLAALQTAEQELVQEIEWLKNIVVNTE